MSKTKAAKDVGWIFTPWTDWGIWGSLISEKMVGCTVH